MRKTTKIIFFICCILMNVIFIVLICYKSTLKTHPSQSVFLSTMQRASLMTCENTKLNQYPVRHHLRVKPRLNDIFQQLESAINRTGSLEENIDALLERMEYDTAVGLDNRHVPRQILFEEKMLELLSNNLLSSYYEMDSSFSKILLLSCEELGISQQALDSILYHIKDSIPQFNPKDVDGLRHATLGECQLILERLHLDFNVAINIWVKEICGLFLSEEEAKEEYKAVVIPKKTIVKKGNPFQVTVMLGVFNSESPKIDYFDINGIKYKPDKNGIVDFRATPTKTGVKRFKVKASSTHPAFESWRNEPMVFEYQVTER